MTRDMELVQGVVFVTKCLPATCQGESADQRYLQVVCYLTEAHAHAVHSCAAAASVPQVAVVVFRMHRRRGLTAKHSLLARDVNMAPLRDAQY
jgi:hypothetical protein